MLLITFDREKYQLWCIVCLEGIQCHSLRDIRVLVMQPLITGLYP